jgi:hypothetical protein
MIAINGDAIHLKPVEIPVGAKAPFTALLLADTHLTLCNARDDERRNALAEHDFFVCAGARPHPWSSDTTSFVFLSISTLRWYGDPQ